MSTRIVLLVLGIIGIDFLSAERIYVSSLSKRHQNKLTRTSILPFTLTINDVDKEDRTLSLSSGQVIRLRHSSKFGEGIVEVFHDNSWGFICEDSLEKSTADFICRQLGFTRGALEEKYTSSCLTENDTPPSFWLTELNCTNNESAITHCFFKKRNVCSTKNNAAGVVCHLNTFAVCEIDEVHFNGKCYKFHFTPQNYTQARQTCLQDNGRLATINSQFINDFLSEYLTLNKQNLIWFVGGKKIRNIWRWEHAESNTYPLFTNWFPGWDGFHLTKRPIPHGVKHCLVLQNQFHDIFEENKSVDYYFWNNIQCVEENPFICEKPQKDIGCIVGNGTNYRGIASISQHGWPCLSWNQPRLRQVIINQYKDEDLGDHPYCRNPDHNTQPWCLVSTSQYDLCDIPRCPDIVTPSTGVPPIADVDNKRPNLLYEIPSTNPSCLKNQFQCNSGLCIPQDWICDGEIDCLDSSDEDNCTDVMKEFTKIIGKKLQTSFVEKWMHTRLAACARKCFYSKSFDCQSFMFRTGANECILTNSNRITSSLKVDPKYDFFELLSMFDFCPKGKVRCDNGRCVDNIKLCNEIENCKDNCPKEIPFDIQLADGTLKQDGKLYEGRVEVRIKGEWGIICDDQWDIIDANVVCKQLGFHLGALNVYTRSYFGSGNGNILMDDVHCKGREKSILDCKFTNQRNHDCTEQEAAGVVCRVPLEFCPKDQWLCGNFNCIQANYLCDKDDDCQDGSDEDALRCLSPLQVRLSDGPNNASGRVEIQRYGIWGTVCDDLWDDKDAEVICRMLGYEGVAKAHRQGHFSPGSGIIWLDNVKCRGDESSIEKCESEIWSKNDCEHKEDAGVTCHQPIQRTTIAPSWEFFTSAVKKPTSLAPDLPSEGFTCGRRIFETETLNPFDTPARIVGGFDTVYGAFPWQAGIRLKFGSYANVHWCGGTIIGEFHIISAAHCFEEYPKDKYLVRVGDFDNSIEEDEEQVFQIAQMFVHEDFNKGGQLNNDIILIKIKAKGGKGIKFGDHVQPICLPDAHITPPENKVCHISGWGNLGIYSGSSKSRYPKYLQAAAVPILPLSWCKARSVYSYKITEAMFCAGYLEGGIDSCQGDSGGPLACVIDGKFTLMGVISWGHGCAKPNKPGVYAKVSHFREWIERKIKL